MEKQLKIAIEALRKANLRYSPLSVELVHRLIEYYSIDGTKDQVIFWQKYIANF